MLQKDKQWLPISESRHTTVSICSPKNDKAGALRACSGGAQPLPQAIFIYGQREKISGVLIINKPFKGAHFLVVFQALYPCSFYTMYQLVREKPAI